MYRPTGIRRAVSLAAATILAAGVSLFGQERADALLQRSSEKRKDRIARDRLFNFAAYRHRVDARARHRRDNPDHYEFQDAVNKLTNYERNQWARVGYPKGLKRLAAFIGCRTPGMGIAP